MTHQDEATNASDCCHLLPWTVLQCCLELCLCAVQVCPAANTANSPSVFNAEDRGLLVREALVITALVEAEQGLPHMCRRLVRGSRMHLPGHLSPTSSSSHCSVAALGCPGLAIASQMLLDFARQASLLCVPQHACGSIAPTQLRLGMFAVTEAAQLSSTSRAAGRPPEFFDCPVQTSTSCSSTAHAWSADCNEKHTSWAADR